MKFQAIISIEKGMAYRRITVDCDITDSPIQALVENIKGINLMIPAIETAQIYPIKP